jgi:hypothetical protein
MFPWSALFPPAAVDPMEISSWFVPATLFTPMVALELALCIYLASIHDCPYEKSISKMGALEMNDAPSTLVVQGS